jgi:hypothetical protein
VGLRKLSYYLPKPGRCRWLYGFLAHADQLQKARRGRDVQDGADIDKVRITQLLRAGFQTAAGRTFGGDRRVISLAMPYPVGRQHSGAGPLIVQCTLKGVSAGATAIDCGLIAGVVGNRAFDPLVRF